MSSVEMTNITEKMGQKEFAKKLEVIDELAAKDGRKESLIPAKPKELQIPKPTKPRLTKKALADRLASVIAEADAAKTDEASLNASSHTPTPTAEDSKTTDESKNADDTKNPDSKPTEDSKNPEEATNQETNKQTPEELKKAEELKNAENTRSSQEIELRSLSPTMSVASVASVASAASEVKDDVEDDIDLTQVIEKLQEEIKILKEGGDVKEGEETGAESVNADSGLSEDSKASKLKNEEKSFETKLMDCIQVSGFMLTVEAEDGRLAEIEWGPQGLHIHCLQFNSVPSDIVMKTNILNTMVPSMNPIAFLELSCGTPTWGQTVIGRVYIRLWGHLRRAHNFLALCMGDRGHSYLNTKFLQGYNIGLAGERMLGGDYETNDGRGGKGVLDDLEWNCDYAMPMKAGMITAAGTGQQATNSLFLICSQSDPERNFSCPFGLVCEGLKVVKDAVQQSNTKDVWITDCGVLIVPPVKL